MRLSKAFWCFVAVCSLWFLSGCQHGAAPLAKTPVITAETPRPARNLIVFDRAWELVNNRFYDVHFNGVDWAAMKPKYRSDAEKAADDSELYSTINRMLDELKVSHLRAKSADRAKDAREHISRSASGLFTLDLESGVNLVWDVYPGSSAAAAGVRRGWIDKTDYSTIDKRGLNYGDIVHCTFEDETNNKREFDLKMTRFVFNEIYESRMLTGGFLYLRFDDFNPDSAKFIKDQLAKHRSAAGVILDLRFNTGGRRDALKAIAGSFFSTKVSLGTFITRQIGKEPALSSKRWYESTYAGPLAVLVSGYSVSAAELFASAVQYHHRGVIIGCSGERTGGHVLGSNTRLLPDGGTLQIAEYNFLTNSGQSLEGTGVIPDQVELEFAIEDVRSGVDTQVKAAIAVLAKSAKPSP